MNCTEEVLLDKSQKDISDDRDGDSDGDGDGEGDGSSGDDGNGDDDDDDKETVVKSHHRRKSLLNIFLSRSPRCIVSNRAILEGKMVKGLRDVPDLDLDALSTTSFNEKWYICSKGRGDSTHSICAVDQSGWNEKVVLNTPVNYCSSIILVNANDNLIAATCSREEHDVYTGCCKGQIYTYEAYRDTWYQIPISSLYGLYDCRSLIGHDSCLYFIDGIPDDKKGKNLQFIDLRTNELHNLALIPEERQGAGACFYQKNLYISGGIGENSFSIFDLNASKWRAVTPLNINRNLHKMFVIDENLFVVGGCRSGNSPRESVDQIIYTNISLLKPVEPGRTSQPKIWKSIKFHGKYVVDSFVF